MRIRTSKCRPPEVDFNDIKIGDLLEFPDNPGWHGGIFMRIWEKEGFKKKNSELNTLHMTRLDDGEQERGCYKTIDRPTGQTYTLTRKMIAGTVNTYDKNRFRPVRVNATLCLEKQS